jgi:four helix bundle protein
LEKQKISSPSIRNQLLRAGTSIGANLEEAVASESRRDFIHKNSIALKEARETDYWLRLIIEVAKVDKTAQKRPDRNRAKIC